MPPCMYIAQSMYVTAKAKLEQLTARARLKESQFSLLFANVYLHVMTIKKQNSPNV